MLINLKDRIDETDVRELLEYSMFDEPEKVDKALEEYRYGPEVELYGLETVDRLVGMVGCRKLGGGELEIRHLSIFPEFRRKGYGALLIKELAKLKRPETISAETDDYGVDFLQKCRLSRHQFGRTIPGRREIPLRIRLGQP